MTLQGILTRLGKGAALTWAEVDSNFTRLKQAVEAFATRFENGALRAIVFSKTTPDNRGSVWARLNSTTNAYETMLYHDGTDWRDMFTRGSWNGVDSSVAANSILLTIAGLGTLLAGQTVAWTNLLANTGDATVTINGGTPIPLRTANGFALTSGALPLGWSTIAAYTGSELRILNLQPPTLLTKKWVSADVAVATASITHTLGVVPGIVTMQLVCQTANNGYAVGDVIDPAMVYVSDGSDQDDYVYIHGTASATHFDITIGADSDPVVFKEKGGSGLRVPFVDAQWKVRITALV